MPSKRKQGGLARNDVNRQTKQNKFLRAYSERGIIKHACEISNIHRSMIYKWIEQDSSFANQMELAGVEATENMESEATRRAVDGCERPVFYQGEECGSITEYSDQLMTFMLKSRNPKRYKDNIALEHTGKDGKPIETETKVRIDNSPTRAAEVLEILEEIGVVQRKGSTGDNSKA